MDEKYILGLRKGSHADFNKLYDLYADRLYGFAYNLTHSSEMAEEIVQEVFLKIWQMREHRPVFHTQRVPCLERWHSRCG